MQPQWQLPFFDSTHSELAASVQQWVFSQQVDESDDRAACREWVQRLGQAGLLRH